jgi:hypothetical protein
MNTRQEIVQRLKNKIPEFLEVGGAADEQRIQNSSVRLPACFVLQLKREANENSTINGVMQQCEEHYAFQICVENIRDDYANDSLDIVNEFAERIRFFFLNWQSEDAVSGMEYEGGVFVSLKNNLLIWAETYSMRKHIQKLNRNK